MNNNQDPLNEIESTKNGAKIMLWVRTAIYVIGLIASFASFVIDVYGNHQLAQVIAMGGSFLAGAVGVIYNPITNIGGNNNGK